MTAKSKMLRTLDESISYGVNKNILHLSTDNHLVGPTNISIEGKLLNNFSSYSYLGLERDERVLEAACDAMKQYGSQFGASRAYVSNHQYELIEEAFEMIFGKPCLLAPSTTLAHQAILPILFGDTDHIIMDQYVHASVQSTVKMATGPANTSEIIRHNNLENLEKSIQQNQQKAEKIWYLVDGVYSMQGDFAPLDELYALTKKYPKLHLYIDDAHGMSWTGSNGMGYAASRIPVTEKIYIVLSLNKAFAGAGGLMVLPNQEMKRMVRTCGGPMIFSTPVPPPMLGANIGSAFIHLSDDIYDLQKELKENNAYCSKLLKEFNLPDISNPESPIFYLAVGQPKVTHNLVHKTIESGAYVTPAIFPAVSMRKSGIRFCISAKHEKHQIEALVESFAQNYEKAFKEENVEMDKISRLFGEELPLPTSKSMIDKTDKKVFITETYASIHHINSEEWDLLFEGKGSFDTKGLAFLENTFSNNDEKENNWNFKYVIIRDQSGKPVVASFLSSTFAKDDMFSSVKISEIVEKERMFNPYYLSSKSVVLGSLLTEGEHLYIDRTNENWTKAVELFLNEMEAFRAEENAENIYLRDFNAGDIVLDEVFKGAGYIQVNLPNSNVIKKDKLSWDTVDDYLNVLSKNSKQNVKRYAIRHEHMFETNIVSEVSEEDLEYYYNLYRQVKDQCYELNTFNLPIEFFRNAVEDENWEIIELRIKAEYRSDDEDKPVLVGLCYKSQNSYCPMIVGMDYRFIKSHRVYRQGIYQVVKRATMLNVENVYFGFTADIEKRNFGAVAESKVAYVQAIDTFNMKKLEHFEQVAEMAVV